MKVGLKKSIVEEDIYEGAKNQRSEKCFEKFKNVWKNELKRDEPKLVNSILKFCALKIFIIGIPITILELIFK